MEKKNMLGDEELANVSGGDYEELKEWNRIVEQYYDVLATDGNMQVPLLVILKRANINIINPTSDGQNQYVTYFNDQPITYEEAVAQFYAYIDSLQQAQ